MWFRTKDETGVHLPMSRLSCSEIAFLCAQVKENKEKVKLNNQLPYLVGNVVEVLDIAPDDEEEEDGAAVDLDSQRKGERNCPLPTLLACAAALPSPAVMHTLALFSKGGRFLCVLRKAP